MLSCLNISIFKYLLSLKEEGIYLFTLLGSEHVLIFNQVVFIKKSTSLNKESEKHGCHKLFF